MDLQMNVLYRYYKEANKTASVNLTDDTTAKLWGKRKHFNGFFLNNILNMRRNSDTGDNVNFVLDNTCCKFISGRCHSAFTVTHSLSTFNQREIKKRI
ncbi:hypothetical protein ACJMK2_026640 [Sinanodonta woodiana]|uniref:PiggyBac transposable element-derived protein domain-containing protein n=1 Tax=Sinanodonta woodiana TaxID=1069815 RepID=A0ABD3XNX1_SINWO